MENRPTAIQVEIFGQTYSVRAAGEAEYILDLAAFVDRKMREVAAHAPTVDSTKIAILTALNVSDEFHQYQLKTRMGDPGRLLPVAGRLVEKLDEILGILPADVPARAGTDISGTLRGA